MGPPPFLLSCTHLGLSWTLIFTLTTRPNAPFWSFLAERRRAWWSPSPWGARVTRWFVLTRHPEDLGFVTNNFETLVQVEHCSLVLMYKWLNKKSNDFTSMNEYKMLFLWFLVAPIHLPSECYKHKPKTRYKWAGSTLLPIRIDTTASLFFWSYASSVWVPQTQTKTRHKWAGAEQNRTSGQGHDTATTTKTQHKEPLTAAVENGSGVAGGGTSTTTIKKKLLFTTSAAPEWWEPLCISDEVRGLFAATTELCRKMAGSRGITYATKPLSHHHDYYFNYLLIIYVTQLFLHRDYFFTSLMIT